MNPEASPASVPVSDGAESASNAPLEITNPACPCWSGYHFLHRPVCGCPTCEKLDGQLRRDLAAIREAEREALRRG